MRQIIASVSWPLADPKCRWKTNADGSFDIRTYYSRIMELVFSYMFPLLYSQPCCVSMLAKHSLKRQCMVWQKLSRRDFGEANRQLDSGTLSGSSVKWSQVSWIVSGSSCWNTWTRTETRTSQTQPGSLFVSWFQTLLSGADWTICICTLLGRRSWLWNSTGLSILWPLSIQWEDVKVHS